MCVAERRSVWLLWQFAVQDKSIESQECLIILPKSSIAVSHGLRKGQCSIRVRRSKILTPLQFPQVSVFCGVVRSLGLAKGFLQARFNFKAVHGPHSLDVLYLKYSVRERHSRADLVLVSAF